MVWVCFWVRSSRYNYCSEKKRKKNKDIELCAFLNRDMLCWAIAQPGNVTCNEMADKNAPFPLFLLVFNVKPLKQITHERDQFLGTALFRDPSNGSHSLPKSCARERLPHAL